MFGFNGIENLVVHCAVASVIEGPQYEPADQSLSDTALNCWRSGRPLVESAGIWSDSIWQDSKSQYAVSVKLFKASWEGCAIIDTAEGLVLYPPFYPTGRLLTYHSHHTHCNHSCWCLWQDVGQLAQWSAFSDVNFCQKKENDKPEYASRTIHMIT